MSVTRHDSDRRCKHVDPETNVRCITRLCGFNPGPDCFIHAARKQRRRREPPGEVERLMRQADERVAA